jgi:tRNA(adenine34) deaminase
MKDEDYMRLALSSAKSHGLEVPVGALVVNNRGDVIGPHSNLRGSELGILGHAEIFSINEALRTLNRRNLRDHTIFVTLEPCPMCAFAISQARLSRVVFGAYDERYGSAGSRYDLIRDKEIGPKIEVVGGVLLQECEELLTDFFSALRSRRRNG